MYLEFIHTLLEIKTKEMVHTFYPQLFEPLVDLASVLPNNRLYHVNLFVQTQAVEMLKEITKKSYIFDDSNLLISIINRLKTEFSILSEDLLDQNPHPWKPN